MRLKRDQDLHKKYKKGIDEYINKGYASKIEQDQPNDAQTERKKTGEW